MRLAVSHGLTVMACLVSALGCAPPDIAPSRAARRAASEAEPTSNSDEDLTSKKESKTDEGAGTDEGNMSAGNEPTPEAPEPTPPSEGATPAPMMVACPTDAQLSQGFGGAHDGIDLANARGTPIYAVSDGMVTVSGSAQGYGQWIRIAHDDGSMTEYGHMYQRDVEAGVRVTAGQQIALMGSEGQSSGPHLHLRTYKNAKVTGAGNGMNPVDYLGARGIAIPCKAGVVAAPPPGSVTASVWKATELRKTERLNGEVIAALPAGSYVASCWKAGDSLTAEGVTNDRWVKLTAGAAIGFVSGIYLLGDETGGVTTACP